MKVEKEGDGRWVVRNDTGDRLGTILGATGRFQAQTMRGVMLGQESTLARAIALVAKAKTKQ